MTSGEDEVNNSANVELWAVSKEHMLTEYL